MKGFEIGIVSSGRSPTKRTWDKQDIDILREQVFDVAFVGLKRGFMQRHPMLAELCSESAAF